MKNNCIVKVCGMTQGDNIREVEMLGVDFIGFIFYPKSPRCLCQMPSYMPERAGRVGVFVNEDKKNVAMYADRFGLDYIQLHGNEPPAYCRSLQLGGFRLIKAVSVASPKDFEVVYDYEGLCEYYLFDTKTRQYGGSGVMFDWAIMSQYNGATPFLISGGINACSAEAVKAFSHPAFAGIDLNSRFESAPGIKDVEMLRRFIAEL